MCQDSKSGRRKHRPPFTRVVFLRKSEDLHLFFLLNSIEVAFLAANAKRAGLVTFHVNDPIKGRFDTTMFITVLFNHGWALLVTKGVMAVEPPDRLSTVSENFVRMEEVTPLVSIVPQLSFRYCS